MKRKQEEKPESRIAQLEKELAVTTRNLEIEAALERVRARAMAMQSSDELAGLVTTLFNELSKLHFTLARCLIWIIDAETLSATTWMANPGVEAALYQMQYFDHPYYKGIIKAWKARKPKWAYELKGEEKRALDDIVLNLPALKNTPEVVKAAMRAVDKAVISFSFANFGGLQVDGTEPLSEDNVDILARFSKVFDQTYTRFKDLKQAEAQTREAQIELGLERVRAKTMAMHNSDDVADTVVTMFDELVKLGIEKTARCGIAIIDDNREMELWRASYNADGNVDRVIGHIDMTIHPLLAGVYQAWKNNEAVFSWELTGKDQEDYFRALSDSPEYPVQFDLASLPAKQINSVFFFPEGCVYVFTIEPISPGAVKLFKRFAAVFGLTYRRYLDLKKAEAQARESQIQLALERVRARTMAMQKSEELAETATVLFQQLLNLGISAERTIIGIPNEDTRKIEFWGTEQGGNQINTRFEYEADATYAFREIYKGWQEKRSELTVILKGENLREHVNYVRNVLHMPLLAELVQDQRMLYNAFFSKGWLELVTPEIQSKETLDILQRFAGVFDGTYTRFLDLQKAEAQAREAQIQLALERVRARTMAMQKSEELAETAAVLFQQLLNLGISSERTFIGMPNDDTRKIELWGTEQGGNQMSMRFEYEADATYAFREIYKAWQAKRSELTVILKGKNLDEHVNYVRNVLHMPILVGLVQQQRILYNAFFSKGLLMIVTPEIQSDETLEILQRFAGVFDGTYTRFLDLQRAEDQAREAKIETALERVRAVAMSMMRSDELLGVCESVYTQLNELGFTDIRDAQIYIRYDEQREFMNYSFSDYHGAEVVRVGYDSHPRTRRLFDVIQNTGEAFVEHDIAGEELKEWKTYLKNSIKQNLDKKLQKSTELHYYLYSIGSGALGVSMFRSINDEEINILKRFRNVFNLSYQRYTDIARAEEQAREAKIETALERVRSRTMAMFKSDELAEAAVIVFKQLDVLGISPDRVFIGIFMEDTGEMECWATDQGGHQLSTRFIGKLQQPSFAKIYTVWKAKEKSFSLVQTGQELEDYINYFRNELGLPFKRGTIHDKRVQNVAFFSNGLIGFTTGDIPPPGIINILERFAGVFNLTYTRFLDLQKAEVQARDAKIETSLERVRSKTMAMHNSQDVGETVAVMFDELVRLGVETTARLGIVIIDETSNMEVWAASADVKGQTSISIGRLDMTINPILQALHTAWKNKQTMFSYPLAGEEMKAYYRALNNAPDYPSHFDIDALPEQQAHNSFLFAEGAIFIFSLRPLPEEITQIFKKFAGVFGQTYRRYLDLQKAEAQAREAKIEASLERVRSKTMAMHNSQDVSETVAVMFDELVKLGVETTSRLGIVIIDDTSHMEVWTASADAQGKTSMRIGRLDMTIHPLFQGLHTAWKNKETLFSCPLAGEDVKAYYRTLNNSPDYPSQFNLDNLPKRQEYNSFIFPEGAIFIFSLQPLTTEITQIFKKFTGVFGQTYRRYLDLQKAETQAREAQIEASLERVRSKAMAMRDSSDLLTAASTVFAELQHLGIKQIRSGVGLIAKDFHKAKVYSATSSQNAVDLSLMGEVTLHGHPVFEQQYQSWLKRENYFVALEGKELASYYKILSAGLNANLGLTFKKNQKEYGHWFMFSDGFLYAWSDKEYTDAEIKILERFKNVIELTIGRYLELQKAETQAREAQIEASLERVRGKALAMYNSKDLSSTASLVFTELRKLGVNSKRCGVALLSKNSRHTQLYVATTTLDTDSLDLIGAIELSGHPSLEKQYESWLKNEDYFTVLKGEELKSYKELIYSMLPVPYDHSYHEEFGYYLAFSEGFLFSWAEKPFSEIEINILNRFKSIIDLTFRRYIELQKSEANAREAIRQSSLDRVRAEIASMRTTGDLDRITPLIWNELTILGVPFIRCGVFIMDEPHQLIHTYLSTPEGKAIAAFQLHFNADNGSGVNGIALQGWRQKQAVTLHWTEEEFRNFSHSLMEQGEITSEENYLTEHPPTGLELHFFPFLQGMLYAGNTEPLTDDDKDLVQSLADAFSTAYARYEDFNRLELAKQQVEHTLSDLKSAQTKLVQSEKMASLGELTAGIAHEIQNPLNFVNNFSEVNQEMIEELEEELNAGNIEEALALAADIKQNEQKINHHGKRADGIVKGMLEHSRTGGGEKMPINMNALADEFMRLSYHGLRAKDKAFNAEMITSFDPELPKINVVGQDMGRVILNLFNNAFYAVNQKKKTADAAYRPTVEVETFFLPLQGIGGLKVKDNGIGIPDAIKEKIMQPFFTTKPTGEGTGLGLSLTYDMVVKGHGGSIQVNSVEGEGSEFIILLPIN